MISSENLTIMLALCSMLCIRIIRILMLAQSAYPYPPIPNTHTHTSTMPSKRHAFGGWSTGHPDGEEGDEVPNKVRQHVCCIRHDSQTASQITTCEKEILCT